MFRRPRRTPHSRETPATRSSASSRGARLGKKRALEVEVEALSQGLLPQSIVDSLDAARYLGDDEEYWPFDGEDWSDEYVSGENVK
ncbi:MAG: hypothetical protein ABI488_01200 [Polyangiaceae bacterium]